VGLAFFRQSFFKNHKGNIERSETQYRFNGEVLIMRLEHQGINEIYNYETDHLGRKKSFKHTLNGTLKNVSRYEFDEIGRLKTKNLSPSIDIGTQASGEWNNTNVWLNNIVPSVNDHVMPLLVFLSRKRSSKPLCGVFHPQHVRKQALTIKNDTFLQV
jgi:hypothetical protein